VALAFGQMQADAKTSGSRVGQSGPVAVGVGSTDGRPGSIGTVSPDD